MLIAAFSLVSADARADVVPLAAPVSESFLSEQLRGLSFGSSGETVEQYIVDDTNDNTAYVSLTVTADSGTKTLYSYNFTNSIHAYGTNTSSAHDLVLPYNTLLTVTETGYEYTRAALYYGSALEASGGWFNGQTPSFTTSLTITAPTDVPEPSSLSLLGAGIAGLLLLRRASSRLRPGPVGLWRRNAAWS